MATIVTVGQNQAGFWYRFNFPSGEYYIIGVEPCTPEMGRDVAQTLNENYALIIMLYPVKTVGAFLEGVGVSAGYVAQEMRTSDRASSFIAAIIQSLTLVRPADDLVDLANAWYEGTV